jgi:GntR family transcriptional regulator, transcriptional repressor for pyruvate dehydrogenase complex
MPPRLSRIELAPREPLGSEIARRLLNYLLSGAVSPGDRIPSERQLADALGVNRPAVREAIRALGFLGLLEVRQGSGTYFRGLDQELLFRLFEWTLLFGDGKARDLLETRADLEIIACGRAAERRSQDDVANLEALLEDMRTSDQDRFPDADLAFHAGIAAMAGNVVLEDMLASIRTVIRGWVERNIMAAGTTQIAYRDHVPICRAIAAGDPEAARTAMAAHMQAAIRRLLAQDRRRHGTPPPATLTE